MNASRTRILFLCAIAVSVVPGCGALSAKGPEGAARFFSIEPPADPAETSPEQPGTSSAAELRLGRVTGSSHLEERVVYRNSPYEIGYYREVRWTEPPEAYLKRLLARALFEVRGFKQVVGGGGPTLDVVLTAFDEVRVPQHLARAQLVATLHDERLVMWEETVTVDRPIAPSKKGGDPAAETVAALGDAMQAAIEQVASRVAREVEERNRTR